jgi:radical SAM protein (TIGR01212 family)
MLYKAEGDYSNKGLRMEKFVWGHKRRFNSYPEYFKAHFGNRVQKLTVDAGFTCPNRDGSKGHGGCTFCNNNAFSPGYCVPSKSITQQLQEGIQFHKMRYRRVEKYLAYFQSYSNTYGPLDQLKKMYEEALAFPGIIGFIIGTRPDCVNEELLNYLSHLSEDHYIMIEYGIESCYNSTLQRVNRGHTFEESMMALEMTARKGISQGAHFIIGLPGETEKDIIEEVDIISGMPVNIVKFHHLQIFKNTQMAKEYEIDPSGFRLFSIDEYLDLLVRIIERLNPRIVVDRIASETNPEYLVTKGWGPRYDEVLRRFEKRLELNDTYQGKHYVKRT